MFTVRSRDILYLGTPEEKRAELKNFNTVPAELIRTIMESRDNDFINYMLEHSDVNIVEVFKGALRTMNRPIISQVYGKHHEELMKHPDIVTTLKESKSLHYLLLIAMNK